MYRHYYKNDTQLIYSVFHPLMGKPVWLCRIWMGQFCKEGWGNNKFTAYRNAQKSHWEK